jgi:hypothetical protein
MADWATISSMATAAGTLVLAVATFTSIKSANRSARVAERTLLAGVRPVLIPSREDDPVQRMGFGDGHVLSVAGHGAAFDVPDNGNIYLAIALRNGGSGLAVIHGWRLEVMDRSPITAAPDDPDAPRRRRPVGTIPAPDPDAFRRQQRDLYIPAGENGFWQGAIRDRDDPDYAPLCSVRSILDRGARVTVDLLYSDHEGGQRTIARFGIQDWPNIDGERAEILRYWSVDGDNPR